MSAGIAILGRDVTITVGGAAITGKTSDTLTCNNEPVDTTDDAAGGWAEVSALPGLKSIEFSVSGVLKNLELLKSYSSGSQMFAVSVTWPDGTTTNSSLTFDAFMSSFSITGETSQGKTFDASFQSSGAATFTAGT